MVWEFDASVFSEYRAKRMAAGVSPATMNREHAYLRAVFNELRRLGQWAGENPLASVRQFKEPERELSFLTLEQISSLLKALERNGDAYLVAKVCLATGTRWTEAEALMRPSQVRGGMVHLVGTETKSKKNRSVPISEGLEAELSEYGHRP